MSNLLNLEQQLRFYGAYHHNSVNIFIHTICVPIILWTAILLCTNTPSLFTPPQSIPYASLLPPNLGLLVSLAYSTLYILLEPVAGTAFALLLFASTAYANHLTLTTASLANRAAVVAHVLSWIAQFVGHGVFEGRAPALLDNLFQAIFLAPLFVWLEVLFAVGYRPELKKRLDGGVEEDLRKFRAEKEKGKEVNGAAGGMVTRSQGKKGANGHAKSS